MRIYLASSWRNPIHGRVLGELRAGGHEVYDFKNPPGRTGFAWTAVLGDDWLTKTTPTSFLIGLEHPVAIAGFNADMDALRGADACVLVLPCGRSAHLELGFAVGAGKRTIILAETLDEPELMYRMVDRVALSVPEVLDALDVMARTPIGGRR